VRGRPDNAPAGTPFDDRTGADHPCDEVVLKPTAAARYPVASRLRRAAASYPFTGGQSRRSETRDATEAHFRRQPHRPDLLPG
jgi:hypothetical protein